MHLCSIQSTFVLIVFVLTKWIMQEVIEQQLHTQNGVMMDLIVDSPALYAKPALQETFF